MSGKGANQRRREGLTAGNNFGATVVLEVKSRYVISDP